MPVDLSASIYAQYKLTRKRAEDAVRRGAPEEARVEHHRAAELMRQYAGYAYDISIRAQRLQRADAHEKMANQLNGMSAERAAGGRDKASPTAAAEPVSDTDYESEIMGLIEESKIRWADIGGLEETKQAIKSAFGLAVARKPKGVRIDSWRNLLFFGPPGTGKTLLAAATAGSLEATFFNVKVSNVLSKYFGESTKILSALYATARRLSPAVIFLDEFESLTPPRGEGESGAERRIVSTLLAELDGMSTKDDESYVLTIGATNLPWALDNAILSRFQKRIFVPLPDAEARRAILEIHIPKRGHKLKVSLEDLVTRTDGYSGREIEQICQTAITHMTQRANPGLMDIVDQGQAALRNYEIKVAPLDEEDFKVAFSQIHPSTDPQLLQRHREWLSKAEA
ncbi:MAG: AAA family ATPase [Anaerolineales bacterium]